jgi:cyclopropane fatty-acyl-phospholipid synthase-like methyltransferase
MGCGNGSRLGGLVQLYPISAIGFDVSDHAIQVGRSKIEEYGLAERMSLYRHSLHDEWEFPHETQQFDLIYSIQAMQFSTHSQIEPLMAKVSSCIIRGGRFCFLVRSTSRSVPSSYEQIPGELNTYLSNEPHEKGMVYHHYSEADVHMMAGILRGRIEFMREAKATRSYDPHPNRAWWEVVIRC